LEEFNETIGIVGKELKIENYSMEIAFTTWIICILPTRKNIKLEIIDQFLGHVSKILVGSFKSTRIAKIRHC
jgi:hypothetical protein